MQMKMKMKTRTALMSITAVILGTLLNACGGEDYSAYANTPEGQFVTACSGSFKCSGGSLVLERRGETCAVLFSNGRDVQFVFYPDKTGYDYYKTDITWKVSGDAFAYCNPSGCETCERDTSVHGGGGSGGGSYECNDQCLEGCVAAGLSNCDVCCG